MVSSPKKQILIIDSDHKTTSPLQKILFTETYSVEVVNTLEVAETILTADYFDLVIFDPLMWSKNVEDAIAWMNGMAPGSHFIIISKEIEQDSFDSNKLLSFQKPLDYKALMEKIRMIFSSRGFTAVVEGLNLTDYIQIICLKKSTKALSISDADKKGIILIDKGKVRYAVQGRLTGEDAFYEIMGWKNSAFHEIGIRKLPNPNVDRDINSLILNAADADNGDWIGESDLAKVKEVKPEEAEMKVETESEEVDVKEFQAEESKITVTDPEKIKTIEGQADESRADKVEAQKNISQKTNQKKKSITVAPVLFLAVFFVVIMGIWLIGAFE